MGNLPKEIERRLAKLDALERGGVDNWTFYDEAMKPYRNSIELEEEVYGIVEDICAILSSGSYEPSERGAGVAFNENRIKEVEEIILSTIKKYKTDIDDEY